MAAGLVARKAGMTQIFAEDGAAVPVTVLNVEPCRVVALRTSENDGYDAIQVGFGAAPRVQSRAVQGHYAKQGQDAMRSLKEFRLNKGESFELGQELTAEMFEVGQKIDVSGTSKGHGFAGVMKRYDFGGGRATHGAEKTHRQMGSTGQCQWPGRVFPGKKMPGHYGDVRITTQNLTIVRIDAEAGRILVKGAVPGAKSGYVELRPAVKGA
ncbi:MAG: 50S ribosomal protein L3 [Zetaproteobacteria bacterium CG12_big_fil_rev_8_21_14_0_65_55_1124]|nr:MAG: 50S ribosomal protein L3 [Zetaproteobacteria bacterium CG1_02_55_237]PIW43347.1 MAG: 50S ribosomal protein L3 [Zetaproteobacteria bacterium CG12_big_fil_rev_8_21_14_0_65_55_1124]PIY52202.1 MAG: 50S ribosomal protein L3 [Zetaproteobacteria bacterium CG_4_10_14_0_8_um_filter_55_43]PIZ37752.1 MAG: 50S ribosomal protein L3 [Zetaproteobacteria bacterium CG_4_10_14_0_2_um_filter_55_20]PJB79583.1 MAG: 50S ribosomal protein L3 [Zetaproteobacteria bacterium CG_4_9_14_0_8_um_filter_55_31]